MPYYKMIVGGVRKALGKSIFYGQINGEYYHRPCAHPQSSALMKNKLAKMR